MNHYPDGINSENLQKERCTTHLRGTVVKEVLVTRHMQAATAPVPKDIDSTRQPAGVAGAAGHAVPAKPIRRVSERWLAVRTDAP